MAPVIEEQSSRPPSILVVEDVADIRDVFAFLLRAEGASVVAVPSGREAVEVAESETFDIVVTDLGLPDIPGDMVIREVLSRTRNRPRVVVVTGYGEPYVARARRAGADVVLTKPVAWSTLVSELHMDSGGGPHHRNGFAA
jgi:CheY-like chemotaxis protein